MIIKDFDSLKEYFKKIKIPVFGAGVYAFDRLGLENIYDKYRILALRYSLDTKLIEKDIEVLSLEKGMGTKHIREPRNATTVLNHPRTEKYLSGFENPAVFVYKPSTKMEDTCRKNGWKLLNNPTSFGKDLLENKIKFRRILKEIEVPFPSGKISSTESLHYGHLINAYGLPFVIQHPTRGSGKGTYFINDKKDFETAKEELTRKWDEEREKEIIPPDEVIVAQFVRGVSPSITGCVTKDGILSTGLQHQILDIAQLSSLERGSGLFCGHDWTISDFSEKINQQAYQIVEKVGRRFKEMGYKGIFGLDFVLDPKKEKLYVVECNPRFLGSFPTLTMIQARGQEPPILGFHILEFLGLDDYQIDIEEVNRKMREPKTGAQMILHNLTTKWARNHREIKPGVYLLENKKMKYLRPGYDFKHLEEKKEFLITYGVPFKRSHFSPNRRLCRILTLNSCLDQTYKDLNLWAKQVAESVYSAFEMRPVRMIKVKKIFNPHFLAKG